MAEQQLATIQLLRRAGGQLPTVTDIDRGGGRNHDPSQQDTETTHATSRSTHGGDRCAVDPAATS